MSEVGIPLLDDTVVELALAAALGLFLGLEREWSDKTAGIRTFALVSLVAAVFTILERPLLVVVGALFVVAVSVVLGVQGLVGDADTLSLTTSTTLLVAYGAGALVASGFVLEGVAVAVVSSLLLVLRKELHGIADALSREEVRAGTEFAILAFVIYPLLPVGEETVGSGDLSVSFEPRVVWLMVVFVAGIGIVNYAIVRVYGGRGIAVTGFFGGLASSTAVVGAMLDHVDQRAEAADYGVAAVALVDVVQHRAHDRRRGGQTAEKARDGDAPTAVHPDDGVVDDADTGDENDHQPDDPRLETHRQVAGTDSLLAGWQ